MNLNTTLKLFFVLLFSSKVFASQKTFAIGDAIRQGLEYSPDVKKADANVKAATATLNKASGALFPTVNAVASALNKTDSTTATTSTISPTVSSANSDTYQAGLTLTQPLYAGGALTGGINLYKTQEDIARQAYYTTKETFLQSLISAYYTFVQSELTLEAAKSNRDVLESFVKVTKRYAHIGRSRKMDELQAQANYTLSLIDTEQNQVLLLNNQTALNKYLGEPSSTLKSNFQVTIHPLGNLSVEEALQTAVKNNPQIISDQFSVNAVEYTKDVDLSQDMPSLNLAATSGYQSPDMPDMWNGSSKYYSVGLNLTIPIFSGLSSISKRRIYGSQKFAAEKQLQIDMDNLRLQIESSISSIKSAQRQLELSEKSVKEARQALDLANKSYIMGIAAVTDVIANQTTRYSAEKIFITAQFGYLSALLALRQQMGIDLEKAYAH